MKEIPLQQVTLFASSPNYTLKVEKNFPKELTLDKCFSVLALELFPAQETYRRLALELPQPNFSIFLAEIQGIDWVLRVLSNPAPLE